VRVELTTVTQPNPALGQPLMVAGGMTTAGSEPVTDLTVRVARSRSPFTSRTALERFDTDPTTAAVSVQLTSQPLAGAVTRNASVQFSVTTEPGRLGLGPGSALGVYPLRVSVTGTVGGRRGIPVGSAAGVLVWAPSEVRAPTPVAVVLPLADRPRLRSDGILTDDTLADEVKPGGRLYDLLDAARPPIALAVDPTLVHTLMLMAKGPYAVATPAGVAARHPRDPNAQTFLDNLRRFAALRGSTVFALPYGDVDVTAMVRADTRYAIRYAVSTGQIVLTQALDRVPDGGVAYPAGGLADPATVNLLGELLREQVPRRVPTVILDDRLLPASANVTYTPGAAVELPMSSGGSVRALAADTGLARVVTSFSRAEDGRTPSLAEQRVRAELAMIYAERPLEQRLQVLALPRYWDPPANWATTVFGVLTTVYSRAVPLSWTGSGGARSAPRVPVAYPAWAAAAETPASYIAAVQDLRNQVDTLRTVLCPRDAGPTDPCLLEKVNPMTDTLLTAMSVAWRGSRHAGAVALSQQVDGKLKATRNGIRVVASRIVTLTSSRGRVPVTLENNTENKITIVLSLSSTDRTRLRSATRETRTVEPHQKEQVEIEVNAESAGTFPVDIQLLTPDGRRLSPRPATRVLVRSTVYGKIATVVTVGGMALLVFAVVIRLVRRIRGRGGSGPAGSPLGPAPAPAGSARSAEPLGSPGSARSPGSAGSAAAPTRAEVGIAQDDVSSPVGSGTGWATHPEAGVAMRGAEKPGRSDRDHPDRAGPSGPVPAGGHRQPPLGSPSRAVGSTHPSAGLGPALGRRPWSGP
jgi:hypothetical protein